MGRRGPEVAFESDRLVGNGITVFFRLDRNLDLRREGQSRERRRLLRGRPGATLSSELPRREADPACPPLRGCLGLPRVPSEWPFGFGPCSRSGVDPSRKANSLHVPRSDGPVERRRKRNRGHAWERLVQSPSLAYVGPDQYPRPPRGRAPQAFGPTRHRVPRRHVAGLGERRNVAGRRRPHTQEQRLSRREVRCQVGAVRMGCARFRRLGLGPRV